MATDYGIMKIKISINIKNQKISEDMWRCHERIKIYIRKIIKKFKNN